MGYYRQDEHLHGVYTLTAALLIAEAKRYYNLWWESYSYHLQEEEKIYRCLCKTVVLTNDEEPMK
jgi:hypothetical protein